MPATLKYLILAFYFLITGLNISAQQVNIIDSLETLLKGTQNDSLRLRLMSDLSWEYSFIDREKAIMYAEQSLSLASKKNNLAAQAQAYKDLSGVYFRFGEILKASQYAENALALYVKLENKREIAVVNSRLGVIKTEQGDLNKALTYNLKALKVFEEIKDSAVLGVMYANIGALYVNIKNYQNAEEYFEKALIIDTKRNNQASLSRIYAGLASLAEKKQLFPVAIDNYLKALNILKTLNDKLGIEGALINIGRLYRISGNDQKGLEYYNEGLKLSRELKDTSGMAICISNLGNIYFDSGNYKQAEINYLEALNLKKNLGNRVSLYETYENLAILYSKTGNYRKSAEYYELYANLKDSVYNEESSKQIAEMQTKYESDKKEKAIALLTKEKEVDRLELNKKRILTYSFAAGLILVLLLAGVIFNGYRQKQKANDLLSSQNSAIVLQKQIIEEKNKDITDSIKYAQRIQEAILPSDQLVNKLLPDSFVLYKPKDIVSGDFYFVSENSKDAAVIVAAVDCTGHGVPGAFMSIVGHNGLTRAVNEQGLSKPADILNYLNKTVNETLRQSFEDSSVRDGMDICLVCIQKVSNEIKVEYSGAFNPLVIVKDNSLLEINADKQPVGAFIGEHQKPFTNKEVSVAKGDILYLFTDGYADQFGGEKGKKLKYKKLKELLLEINSLDMSEQKKRLEADFNSWRGDLEQVDDVCIIGVRV